MARPWILVVPHPDDETLAAGVCIAEHVAAGRDVHILLLTRGTDSGAIRKINGIDWSPWWGVWHNPTLEGYQPLTPTTMGVARYGEMVAALGCLGVSEDRVHEAGLIDGQVTVAAVKTAILDLADTFDPAAGAVGLWTPSDVVDNNPDHIAAGQASRQLGAEDPARWADRRYYVLPPYWQDPRLSQVSGEAWDLPTDVTIERRARNACRAYQAWSPTAGSYAFGYHSVPDMFGLMDGTTSPPRALVHK